MRVAILTFWACLVGSAGPGAARAESPVSPSEAMQPLAEAIDVSPGATCLREASVVGQTRMWLQRDVVDGDLRVHVRGDVREPHEAVFDIVRGGTTRTRSFDRAPQDCDELHAAVGLAIALAIDMAALDDLAIAPRAQPQPGPRWLATFLLGFGQELLPGTALAGEVGLEFAPVPLLRLRADVLVQHAFGARIPGSQGRLDATLLAGGFSLCMGGELARRLSASLCAGPLGGEIFARGRGYDPNHRNHESLFGVRSGGRMVVTAGIAWVLDVDVVALVRAPTYEVAREDAEPLLRGPSSAAFSVLLGPALRF